MKKKKKCLNSITMDWNTYNKIVSQNSSKLHLIALYSECIKVN